MINDILTSLKFWRIWFFLSYEETRTDYRHTVLGPWWSIINIILLALPVCVLYKHIFHSQGNYYAYALSGLIIWNFINSSITSGVSSIISSSNYLKEIKLPFSLFLIKNLIKQSIPFFHMLLLFCLYLIIFQHHIFISMLLLPISFLLLLMALFFLCFFGAILTVYFRDFLQIMPKLLNFLFLATPIIWQKHLISPKYQFIAQMNPLAILIDIVRKPLIGIFPTIYEYMLVCIIILFGFLLSFSIYQHSKKNLIFFL
jgi:lipopolysaccharide transport system permease protein